jgi:hypothetical protein
MSFFNLEVLKGPPTKSIKIMPCLKFSKNMILGQKIWKRKNIGTHMDLWKYSQFFSIQKSLTIEWLWFSKKRFFIWVYLVLHYMLNPNNNLECESIFFFYLVMFQLDNQSIFFNFKSPLLLTNEFCINKWPHNSFAQMKLLV